MLIKMNNNNKSDGEENNKKNFSSNIITIIKNINYNNNIILNGDVSSDGKIFCLCHDKFFTIWDTVTLKTLAIIKHPLYTSLNEHIFNLYKGIEVIESQYNTYILFFSFDTIFIYSLEQFHLIYQEKFKGIIEYVKFDKYTNKYVAIGITKKSKQKNNQLIQKNYIYEFNENYLKRKKLFYSTTQSPILLVDFAPFNILKNKNLNQHHKSTILVSLNSKFQVHTFYINNYPNFLKLN
ncbi:hypothetical protein C923_03457 [Plasmodium falciparum UGT5.1]|uniref:WD repeat-containing protein n=1 Tax=Plasmodium falciparum UGT5.1 TaxID=1237627 RepID=W7JLL7_PLAFA|nr:hypothetical protein C923_03457 [Plasmodium falciparum UGT5.1]